MNLVLLIRFGFYVGLCPVAFANRGDWFSPPANPSAFCWPNRLENAKPHVVKDLAGAKHGNVRLVAKAARRYRVILSSPVTEVPNRVQS